VIAHPTQPKFGLWCPAQTDTAQMVPLQAPVTANIAGVCQAFCATVAQPFQFAHTCYQVLYFQPGIRAEVHLESVQVDTVVCAFLCNFSTATLQEILCYNLTIYSLPCLFAVHKTAQYHSILSSSHMVQAVTDEVTTSFLVDQRLLSTHLLVCHV